MESVTLEFSFLELEKFEEVLSKALIDLGKAKQKADQGESIYETFGMFETDVAFLSDIFQKRIEAIKLILESYKPNTVESLERTNMFRLEQAVEVFHVVSDYGDRLVYVFEGRHGGYYIYRQLEDLVSSFVKGEESEVIFYSEIELMHYLSYMNL